MSEARGEARPPDPSGPPERPFSVARAAALLVLAVALGVYLLSLGTPGPRKLAAARATSATSPTRPAKTSPPTTTTPTTAPPTTSSSGGTAPSGAVKVLVANASQTNGVAAYYSGKLSSAGWGTLTPVTASTAKPTSSVYFATGEQGAAQAIAASLGVPSGAVQAMSASVVPVASTTGADVVVVVGNDLASKVPAGG